MYRSYLPSRIKPRSPWYPANRCIQYNDCPSRNHSIIRNTVVSKTRYPFQKTEAKISVPLLPLSRVINFLRRRNIERKKPVAQTMNRAGIFAALPLAFIILFLGAATAQSDILPSTSGKPRRLKSSKSSAPSYAPSTSPSSSPSSAPSLSPSSAPSAAPSTSPIGYETTISYIILVEDGKTNPLSAESYSPVLQNAIESLATAVLGGRKRRLRGELQIEAIQTEEEPTFAPGTCPSTADVNDLCQTVIHVIIISDPSQEDSLMESVRNGRLAGVYDSLEDRNPRVHILTDDWRPPAPVPTASPTAPPTRPPTKSPTSITTTPSTESPTSAPTAPPSHSPPPPSNVPLVVSLAVVGAAVALMGASLAAAVSAASASAGSATTGGGGSSLINCLERILELWIAYGDFILSFFAGCFVLYHKFWLKSSTISIKNRTEESVYLVVCEDEKRKKALEDAIEGDSLDEGSSRCTTDDLLTVFSMVKYLLPAPLRDSIAQSLDLLGEGVDGRLEKNHGVRVVAGTSLGYARKAVATGAESKFVVRGAAPVVVGSRIGGTTATCRFAVHVDDVSVESKFDLEPCHLDVTKGFTPTAGSWDDYRPYSHRQEQPQAGLEEHLPQPQQQPPVISTRTVGTGGYIPNPTRQSFLVTQ